MGNVALCAPSLTSNGAVKILSSDGKLITIYKNATLKAAEIMLQNQGQFLCRSSDLIVGQRIAGVNAEEELERGEMYYLLPMEMLYSVLTDEEMNSIIISHKYKVCKGISFSNIFPEFCLFQHSNSEFRAIIGGDCSVLLKERRYSRQRSWQPDLETIVETPPHT